MAADPCRIETPEQAIAADLESCRPEPLSTDSVSALLAELPAEGQVLDLTPQQRSKIAELEIILRAQQRSGRVPVAVVDMPIAWAGLHRRGVVLVSQIALRVLTTEQLQAVVAHELAHEYVWDRLHSAMAAGRTAEIARFEIICDILAARILANLSMKPAHLADAVDRLVLVNQWRGFVSNGSHPEAAQRRAWIHKIRSK
jgi:hypothetical protein